MRSLRCVMPGRARCQGNGPLHKTGHGLRGDLSGGGQFYGTWERVRPSDLSALQISVKRAPRNVLSMRWSIARVARRLAASAQRNVGGWLRWPEKSLMGAGCFLEEVAGLSS